MKFRIRKILYANGHYKYRAYVKRCFFWWTWLGHEIGGGGSGDFFYVGDEFATRSKALKRCRRYVDKQRGGIKECVWDEEYTESDVLESR